MNDTNRQRRTFHSFIRLAVAFAIGFLMPHVTVGQLQPPDTTAEDDAKLVTPIIRGFKIGELESMKVPELTKLYKQETENLRDACKTLRREGARFFHADSANAPTHGKNWQSESTKAKKIFQRLKEISLVLFLKSDSPNDDLAKMARFMLSKSFQDGRLGISYKVNKKLLDSFPDDQQLIDDFARVAAYTNDFETAAEFAESNKATIAKFPVFDMSLFSGVTEMKEKWKQEQTLRQQEAKQDDLPRVEFETTKGKIVIELFENEAPHTVGNFVSLVEQDYYKDLIFHFVIRNYQVRNGLYSLKAPRETGYKIVDESANPNARHLFRGSVSMAPPLTTTGASEFFINLSPEPFIQTKVRPIVIGHVIEGMEVVESLNVTAKLDPKSTGFQPLEGAQPDMILSSRVVRKREGTVYEPKIAERP